MVSFFTIVFTERWLFLYEQMAKCLRQNTGLFFTFLFSFFLKVKKGYGVVTVLFVLAICVSPPCFRAYPWTNPNTLLLYKSTANYQENPNLDQFFPHKFCRSAGIMTMLRWGAKATRIALYFIHLLIDSLDLLFSQNRT